MPKMYYNNAIDFNSNLNQDTNKFSGVAVIPYILTSFPPMS